MLYFEVFRKVVRACVIGCFYLEYAFSLAVLRGTHSHRIACLYLGVLANALRKSWALAPCYVGGAKRYSVVGLLFSQIERSLQFRTLVTLFCRGIYGTFRGLLFFFCWRRVRLQWSILDLEALHNAIVVQVSVAQGMTHAIR